VAVKNKGIEIWSNPILPYSLLVAPIFLEAPYLSTVWLVRIYVRGCIPKLYLVKAIMKVVRNTVEGVRFIIATVFCLCCGIALRTSPTNKRDKERLRQLNLRREV